jgi:hypothetical protein
MGEFMIEIIALAAAAALVPAIAAFTWIVKKRLDDLQDQIFFLADQSIHIRGLIEQPPYILRKAGEE